MQKLTITRIPRINTIVIKQEGGKFFLASPNSIIIDIVGLSYILKFLVTNKIMSVKVLEAIVDEYRNMQE
jgi:hypothetical protein